MPTAANGRADARSASDVCSTPSRRRRDQIECRRSLHGLWRLHHRLPVRAMSYRAARRRPGDADQDAAAHHHGAGCRYCYPLPHRWGGAAVNCCLARHGEGSPARAYPLVAVSPGSGGAYVCLVLSPTATIEIAVLVTPSVAPVHLITLNAQAEIGNRILAALGYQGRVRDCWMSANWPSRLGLRRALGVRFRQALTWQRQNEAPLTLFCSLVEHAPTPVPVIALDAGAPFEGDGRWTATVARCCLACVGSCPEGALADNPEKLERALRRKQMRVVRTVPENLPGKGDHALAPRLNPPPGRREARWC